MTFEPLKMDLEVKNRVQNNGFKAESPDAEALRVSKIQRAKKHHVKYWDCLPVTSGTAVAILRARLATCYSRIECALRKMNWQKNCLWKTNVILPSSKRNLLFENAALETTSYLELFEFKK